MRGRPLTGVEEAAALTQLAEVADGRVDLLAEQAGLAIGFHDQDADAPVYLQIAQLCIEAGADTSLISRWIEEGRRRAALRGGDRLQDKCDQRAEIRRVLRPELWRRTPLSNPARDRAGSQHLRRKLPR